MPLNLNVPTLADVDATRTRAQPKGESRLQRSVKDDRDEVKLEKVWRAGIWKRDKGVCRWCERKVVKTIELIPEAGQCHHVSGRVVVAIRWDLRNGLLLCRACHERVTGKVNERFLIVSRKTFTVDGVSYINASKPVQWQRVA